MRGKAWGLFFKSTLSHSSEERDSDHREISPPDSFLQYPFDKRRNTTEHNYDTSTQNDTFHYSGKSESLCVRSACSSQVPMGIIHNITEGSGGWWDSLNLCTWSQSLCIIWLQPCCYYHALMWNPFIKSVIKKSSIYLLLPCPNDTWHAPPLNEQTDQASSMGGEAVGGKEYEACLWKTVRTYLLLTL